MIIEVLKAEHESFIVQKLLCNFYSTEAIFSNAHFDMQNESKIFESDNTN